jgi:hypothetical protein
MDIDIIRETLIQTSVGIATFLTLTIACIFFRPLGGLVYALQGLATLKLGWLGRLLGVLTNKIFYLSFVFKTIGYVVSSGGLWLPVLAVSALYPRLFNYEGFLWGMLLAALDATCRSMHDIHLMRIQSPHELLPIVSRITGLDINGADKMTKMQFVRSYYTDMSIIELFVIVSSYGIVSFAATSLGLVQRVGGPTTLSPGESIQSAFHFLRFLVHDPLTMTGLWALPIAIFYGVSLLLYTTFYVSLTSKLVDEPAESYQPPVVPPAILAGLSAMQSVTPAADTAEAENPVTISPQNEAPTPQPTTPADQPVDADARASKELSDVAKEQPEGQNQETHNSDALTRNG